MIWSAELSAGLDELKALLAADEERAREDESEWEAIEAHERAREAEWDAWEDAHLRTPSSATPSWLPTPLSRLTAP